MSRLWPLLLALAAVVVGPVLMRPKGDEAVLKGEETLIVVTPHNEAIRSEFGRGFREWYHAKTGRTVVVDYRTPGGTSEIKRFVQSRYVAGFTNYWKNTLQREWSAEVEKDFLNAKLEPDATPSDDSPGQAARRAFLASKVGCDHDVFFGGGALDFKNMAETGLLVDSGFVAAHPELFNDGAIPQNVGGEAYWDPKGRWIGTTIGAFGIAFNRDQLARLGLSEPRRWTDLGDPRYFRTLALANPTQSSSANKAFEMLIQQQMNDALAQFPSGSSPLTKPQLDAANAAGWKNALHLLQRIGANARYWSDFSQKIAIDIEAGEAAAGMTIDFYGRVQAAAVQRADGTSRVGYHDAEGGTSYGVDPVALFRGAPHPELAKQFIAYLMSPAGQKIWTWKAGLPDGPKFNALHRMPVLPALYAPEFRQFRCTPDALPYEQAKSFTYRVERTGRLFDTIKFIIRVMGIDSHDELTTAWAALIQARRPDGSFPPTALAAFHDVNALLDANGQVMDLEALAVFHKVATRSGDAQRREDPQIVHVRLAQKLADIFCANYRRATELARAGN